MSLIVIYHRIQGHELASCASELGYRARHATTNTAVSLIQKVVELGAPAGDKVGFATLIRDHRVFNELFGQGGPENRRFQQLEMVEANIFAAVRVVTEQKDAERARQLLSLFPPARSGGYSARDLAELCSTRSAIDIDMLPVIITLRGNHKQFGIVRGFEGESACVVELLTRHEKERRQRHVTTVTASTAAIEAASSGEMVTVNSSSLRAAIGSVW